MGCKVSPQDLFIGHIVTEQGYCEHVVCVCGSAHFGNIHNIFLIRSRTVQSEEYSEQAATAGVKLYSLGFCVITQSMEVLYPVSVKLIRSAWRKVV